MRDFIFRVKCEGKWSFVLTRLTPVVTALNCVASFSFVCLSQGDRGQLKVTFEIVLLFTTGMANPWLTRVALCPGSCDSYVHVVGHVFGCFLLCVNLMPMGVDANDLRKN